MDTIIERKKGIRKKHIPYLAIGVLVFAAIVWLIFGNHASKMNVEAEKVTIQTVEKGLFPDYMTVNGQVAPISTVYLSAQEAGIVEEKLVEEGSMVTKGQPIIRLSNPNVDLDILRSETDLAEQENIHRNTELTMEQERLSVKSNLLQYKMDVERSKRKYEQYEKLYNEKLISKEEYLTAKESYELYVETYNLNLEKQYSDSLRRTAQIERYREGLDNIRETFSIVRQRLDNLVVKSPIDGQLGLLDVEIGQMVSTGTNIGQISDLSDYKIEANIDEHYIDRVRQGLEATFERQDRNFMLNVRKVYPEVREKMFKTDFVFVGERPDNIRAGQTYYIRLQLGQPTEAVMIPRGTFYQTTGGKWIFVVTPDGNKAVRREISIGRQNPMSYEVLSGLEPGEKVITSSYDTYGDVQELILK